jgi:hypothetical protein
MLEAAKFYRDCIGDVQRSIIAEMKPAENSAVNFNAAVFETPAGYGKKTIHYNFVLNGTQFEGKVEYESDKYRPISNHDLIEKFQASIQECISRALLNEILSVLKGPVK